MTELYPWGPPVWRPEPTWLSHQAIRNAGAARRRADSAAVDENADARRLHPAYTDPGPWHVVETDNATGAERLILDRSFARAFADRAAADAEVAWRHGNVTNRYHYEARPGEPPAELAP